MGTKFAVPRGAPLEQRFWARVGPFLTTGCREWQGPPNGSGYGTVKVSGRSLLAHRVAWVLQEGVIGDEDCVLHSCDNTLCVIRPHLFLGTRVDNNHDRDQKGRTSRGSHRPGAKLTEEGVVALLVRLREGEPRTRIAADVGVAAQTINAIAQGRKWSHVTRP